MHKSPDDGMDPVWDEMEDAGDDLDQYSYYMDTLKERFLNLIELVSRLCQFSRTNAYIVRRSSISRTLTNPTTRDSCRFSNKHKSIFGISTLTAPAILCLYISIPLLIISLFFTIFFPWAIRRFQKLWYPVDNNNVKLPKSSFTMLSEELPAVSTASSIKLPQTC
jgi:hypothetical protein